MEKIIVATKNQGKLEEIKEILADLPYMILSLKDVGLQVEIEEDQNTFEGNALKKAAEVMKLTGEIALADDSGLEVEALDKKPGVYSARFAGENATDEENNKKLLELMKDVPDHKRKAVFRCAIAMVFPDGRIIQVDGSCPGKIGYEERGTGGFGYDPLFIVDGLNKTFAELDAEQKNQISHRGLALKKLKEMLTVLGQE